MKAVEVAEKNFSPLEKEGRKSSPFCPGMVWRVGARDWGKGQIIV